MLQFAHKLSTIHVENCIVWKTIMLSNVFVVNFRQWNVIDLRMRLIILLRCLCHCIISWSTERLVQLAQSQKTHLLMFILKQTNLLAFWNNYPLQLYNLSFKPLGLFLCYSHMVVLIISYLQTLIVLLWQFRMENIYHWCETSLSPSSPSLHFIL